MLFPLEQGRCQLKKVALAVTLFGFGRVKWRSRALHGLIDITAVKQNYIYIIPDQYFLTENAFHPLNDSQFDAVL
jgi:hypothetical protein